ncbi:chorismate synthase [Elizabethkingia meningoseptica]|uniref:chorismate synthase n=1 Tax=Elizabethkingia meningoseptica TaxID=238 RepID=UPI000332BF60|nr:chorismate synthase [Elizabethkingia meningoseptica]AQX03985.1 chorismate synthase [Elizabethkingia meningoseptica]AQX46025.1 chorismate synthase [Elizabethkingia meningoseptica]EOR30315.1 Chorismate synthase [Elizabethkingia meningoseptica ATCC 13253 = NBRC 12535]KUY15317.1 chorismate synthase [Elizabethkingia meningoseptica]MCL1677279.1 chorismate synthase [Elizabethkingia meningoseptica]
MSNQLGNLLTLNTFGESHGLAYGGIITNFPAGLEVDLESVQHELDRRKPGQSAIVTQRKESDTVKFLSGIFEGKTTGTPIGFIIENENQKSKDYDHLAQAYRPSHADYTYDQKFGFRDHRGGGKSSARETINWVAAGALAKQLFPEIQIHAYVSSVGDIFCEKPYQDLDFSKIDDNIVRCPDEETAEKMITRIKEIKKQGNTIGGTITCVIKNVPTGWGEPVFGKLQAELGKAMLNINACKGFEYGSGFCGAKMLGSEHNDLFNEDGTTKTNLSGGIQGGISNGMDIYFRAAFKPIATILRPQESIDKDGNPVTVEGKGRHDPCVLPRAVPVVEALAAFVLADMMLINKTRKL